MFQQNIVITNEDNVNHHLDFKLVENNSKRWILVSTNKWEGGRMKVQQPQLIPTIINRYVVLDKLQSESEIPHNRNWVSNATCMRRKVFWI
jgi:hypothetical protein